MSVERLRFILQRLSSSKKFCQKIICYITRGLSFIVRWSMRSCFGESASVYGKRWEETEKRMKERFSAADAELILELYGSHKGIMYKTALDFVRNRDDIEDVIQDAILRMIRNQDRLRAMEPKACAVYIARTVYTAAMDHERRLAKDRNRLVSLKESLYVVGEGSPEEAYLKRESLSLRLRYLHEALRELPRSDCELLIGKYINGESDDALADRLGIRPTAMRMRLSRARQRARRIIERKEAEDEHKRMV